MERLILPFYPIFVLDSSQLCDEQIVEVFTQTHELYHHWYNLKENEFATTETLYNLSDTCPTPDGILVVSFDHDLPLSVLIRRRNTQNPALDLLDHEVERFRSSHSPPDRNNKSSSSIPDMISVPKKTHSSTETKVVKKNRKTYRLSQHHVRAPVI